MSNKKSPYLGQGLFLGLVSKVYFPGKKAFIRTVAALKVSSNF